MALDLFGRADPMASTLLDRTHKGTRQAGNKSTLAFRNDIGVPGYTGYIPTSNCVPVDPKGANRHEGKVPTTEHQTRLSRTLPSAASDSLYRATFSAAAAQAQGKDPATLRASGGHWIKTRSRGADVPLSSSTTYRCEILGHEEKADALATTRGSTTTTAGFVVGRNVEHPAPSTMYGRAVTGALEVPVPQIGKVTTYGSMTVKDPIVGGPAAAGRPLQAPQKPEPRPKVAPRGLMPRLDGTSSYHKYFGTYLEDPSSRLATGKHDYTIKAATAELNRGTTRACKHIPGYAGHIAAHPSNKMTDTIRPMAKVDMCSGPSLDQYMRGDLPGYAGFKPQAPTNIEMGQRDTETLGRTTQGAASLSVVPHLPQPIARKNFISSNRGTMSFFSGGGLFVSENGKSNAQRFFMDLRPMEGTPSIYVPSKTTASGYRFNR